MKLTAYPLLPFQIDKGQITVLELGSSILNRKVVSYFVDDTEEVQLFDNDNHPLRPIKDVLWMGNPAYGVDYNLSFTKIVTKQMLSFMDDQTKVKIVDAERELARLVVEASFNLDVPLEVKNGATLESIFKFVGLHFEVPDVLSICAKSELLFNILKETNSSKLVVLTDVSHFVDEQEFASLVEQVINSELNVLLIEFSDVSRRALFSECRYYYVDRDLVDFR